MTQDTQSRLSETIIYRVINLATFVFFALAIIWTVVVEIPTWRRVTALVVIAIAYIVALAFNSED